MFVSYCYLSVSSFNWQNELPNPTNFNVILSFPSVQHYNNPSIDKTSRTAKPPHSLLLNTSVQCCELLQAISIISLTSKTFPLMLCGSATSQSQPNLKQRGIFSFPTFQRLVTTVSLRPHQASEELTRHLGLKYLKYRQQIQRSTEEMMKRNALASCWLAFTTASVYFLTWTD